MNADYTILTTESQKDYELLDSGDGMKLERFGTVILSRPDPQALWSKNNPSLWEGAEAIFMPATEKQKAGWKFNKEIPKEWTIKIDEYSFVIKPTPFKHTGLFPEQIQNWKWISEILSKNTIKNKTGESRPKVLNLFGYTGGATLAAAKAGAEVVHVDGSKAAITWAKQNAESSGLQNAPIRWILDDVKTFLKREVKRGNTYDGIIMDPPAFGRGPNGEVWKIEDDLLDLLQLSYKLLSKTPLFFLINGYASGYSALTYKNALMKYFEEQKGISIIEAGELTISESKSHRLLPAGIFARWKHQ